MLLDLDELILRCRDDRARTYIAEAVACYKAGAYRSAIVSTWIAVAFDIVDKVLELAATGDKAATALASELEKNIEANDYQKALVLERSLLIKSRDEFEIISQQEYLELERLQQDRHRCAHPTRSSATQIFAPSAELARLHIRNAVECLLEHAPAQGKAALASLFAQLESKYFPAKREDAYKLLDGTALRRARTSLVRNFLVALLKKSLEPNCTHNLLRACGTAISYTIEKYPQQAADVMKRELGKLFVTLGSDDELMAGVRLLSQHRLIAASLVEDQVTRMHGFVRSMPGELLFNLSDALEIAIPRIQEAARFRASRATPKEVKESGLGVWLDPILSERVVSAYISAESFDAANTWGKVIIEYADDFSAAEIERLMLGALENVEIRDSFQYPKVVEALRRENRKLPANFEALVESVRAKKEPPPAEEIDDDIPF